MRGRTLDKAVVILDEAQNTSIGQLKMFLTRMGFDAKFIVTGDATQIDLPNKRDSGLLQGIELLKDIPGISMVIGTDSAKAVLSRMPDTKAILIYDEDGSMKVWSNAE